MPLSWNLETLTSWNRLGHSRPVTGLFYLFTWARNGRSGREWSWKVGKRWCDVPTVNVVVTWEGGARRSDDATATVKLRRRAVGTNVCQQFEEFAEFIFKAEQISNVKIGGGGKISSATSIKSYQTVRCHITEASLQCYCTAMPVIV